MFNSSPLGDFVFYMGGYVYSEPGMYEKFSSPLGDFVFYIEQIFVTVGEMTEFSSPLGDFVFYMNKEEQATHKSKSFRPH